MHADDYQPRILIFLGPRFHVRQCSQAVDAGVSPEIDQHNFAAQGFAGQGRGVEPGNGAIQFGHCPFVCENGLSGGCIDHTGSRLLWTQGVDQMGFGIRGIHERKPGEKVCIPAKSDCYHAHDDGDTQGAPYPDFESQRTLQGGERLIPGKERDSQRCCGTECKRQQ